MKGKFIAFHRRPIVYDFSFQRRKKKIKIKIVQSRVAPSSPSSQAILHKHMAYFIGHLSFFYFFNIFLILFFNMRFLFFFRFFTLFFYFF
jgi:hypothetical protein